MINQFHFKAYDKVNNRIFDVEILSKGIAYEEFRDYEDGVRGSENIMQCVGLFCDKGELSYQGDVIRTSDGVVVLFRDFFAIRVWIQNCTLIDRQFTKIGNEYTHPELLKSLEPWQILH